VEEGWETSVDDGEKVLNAGKALRDVRPRFSGEGDINEG
jgi:hypothetical protein